MIWCFGGGEFGFVLSGHTRAQRTDIDNPLAIRYNTRMSFLMEETPRLSQVRRGGGRGAVAFGSEDGPR